MKFICTVTKHENGSWTATEDKAEFPMIGASPNSAEEAFGELCKGLGIGEQRWATWEARGTSEPGEPGVYLNIVIGDLSGSGPVHERLERARQHLENYFKYLHEAQ